MKLKLLAALLVLPLAVAAQTKLSQFPSAGAITGNEYFYANQIVTGTLTSVRMPINLLPLYVTSAGLRTQAKTLIVNNAASTVFVPTGTSFLFMAGTNVSPLTVTFPQCQASNDGQMIATYSAAAVASLTFASPSSSFDPVTSSFPVSTAFRWICNASNATWYRW